MKIIKQITLLVALCGFGLAQAIPFQHIKKIGIASGALLMGGIGLYAKNYSKNTSEKNAQYTINLMWINKALQEKQNYIFPAENKNNLEEKYLNNIFKWRSLNPKSTINLWFDSSHIPAQAVTNTQTVIKEHSCKDTKAAAIQLKDVRELPDVKNNPEVFSDKSPVYFRADLLRVIAAVHTLATTKERYFVYADLDVQPLSQKELFDESTLQNLEKYGTVLADVTDVVGEGKFYYENAFQILSKDKPNLLKAIELILIDLNIKRANLVLKHGYFNMSNPRDACGFKSGLAEVVFNSYHLMFQYFYQLEGLGKLKSDDNKIYNYKKDGLVPLERNRFDHQLSFTIENEELKNKTAKLNFPYEPGLWIPTKKVSVPPISKNYYN